MLFLVLIHLHSNPCSSSLTPHPGCALDMVKTHQLILFEPKSPQGLPFEDGLWVQSSFWNAERAKYLPSGRCTKGGPSFLALMTVSG